MAPSHRALWCALIAICIVLMASRRSEAAGTASLIRYLDTPTTSTTATATAMGDTVYFVAKDPQAGAELWRTDGTQAGTTLVKDINPGVASAWPSQLTVVNGTLYFVADDGAHGYELWKSDGTAIGTTLVKDIYPGATQSGISELLNLNGTLLFIATSPAAEAQLWRSNGAADTTVMVTSPNLVGAATRFYKLIRAGDLVALRSFSGIWRSDGTPDGTHQLTDANVSYMNAAGAQLFYTTETVEGSQLYRYHLWKADLEAATTSLVTDLPAYINRTGPSDLVDLQGTLYFLYAKDPAGSMQLWRSDGTAQGTVMVASACGDRGSPYAASLLAAQRLLFFTCGAANPGTMNTGYELWRSDGTAEGTIPLKSFYHADDRYGIAVQADVHDVLLFSVSDTDYGRELWMSDGLADGTVMIEDIAEGVWDSSPQVEAVAGAKLFLTAYEVKTSPSFQTRRGLWTIDLTALNPHPPQATQTTTPSATALPPSATPAPTATPQDPQPQVFRVFTPLIWAS